MLKLQEIVLFFGASGLWNDGVMLIFFYFITTEAPLLVRLEEALSFRVIPVLLTDMEG